MPDSLWSSHVGIRMTLTVLGAVFAGLITIACASRLDRALQTPQQVRLLDQRSPYLKVHMKNGDLYVLSQWHVDEAARSVTGEGQRFNPARESVGAGSTALSLDQVALFETNVVQRSPSVTALAVITGVSAAMTTFCITNPKACFGSCPTFYVSGAGDRVQAEGFSSSVAPSLESRDIDALYRVRTPGRALSVTMKNEALETHVIRRVRLLAAPRPENGRVIRSTAGDFFAMTDVRPATSCRADEGDCLERVRAFDGHERFHAADEQDLARREIVDLEVAAGAGSRGLILATRQSLASTYLFYQSLAWLGRSASDTLAALERGDRGVAAAFSRLRDAIGGIEVLAQTQGGAWVAAGAVQEMGPLATDVVMVPLPSDATGRIRLRLARGHWRIDYVASAVLGTRLELLSIDPARIRGPNIIDGRHRLTTLPGDVYVYEFPLPRGAARYEFFLESQGYYLEWMRDEWLSEESPMRAAQLLSDPGQALRDLAPEFKKQEAAMESLFWRSRYAHP